MSWQYCSATGQLWRNREIVGVGYSGFGEGRDNPALEGVPNVGPIPRGEYTISSPYDSEKHGPHVMRLTPRDGTDTLGRGAFLIHGDSLHMPGTASHGCVILPRNIREQISESGDEVLEVV